MKRLVSESVDISAPGGVNLLFRKLQKRSVGGPLRQIARGTRCAECKRTKRKCDGDRPCSRCTGLGIECLDGTVGVSSKSSSSFPTLEDAIVPFSSKTGSWDDCSHPVIQWPLSTPETGFTFPFLGPEQTSIAWPSAANIMRVGFDYGMPSEQLHRMFSPLSPRHLGTMGALVQQLMSAGPPPLEPLPENVNMFLDSNALMRGVSRRSTNNMYDHVYFNPTWNRVAGLHAEEMSSRLASKSMPQPTTELRGLCNHLQFLYNTLRNPFAAQVLFSPILTNHASLPMGEEEHWIIVRITVKAHSDGFIINGVRLSPEEYDRGVELQPELRGLFLMCGMTGQEIINSRDLRRQETLAHLMQTEEGRRRLDYLADMVAHYFGVNAPSPFPSPPPFPPQSSRASSSSSSTASFSSSG